MSSLSDGLQTDVESVLSEILIAVIDEPILIVIDTIAAEFVGFGCVLFTLEVSEMKDESVIVIDHVVVPKPPELAPCSPGDAFRVTTLKEDLWMIRETTVLPFQIYSHVWIK